MAQVTAFLQKCSIETVAAPDQYLNSALLNLVRCSASMVIRSASLFVAAAINYRAAQSGTHFTSHADSGSDLVIAVFW